MPLHEGLERPIIVVNVITGVRLMWERWQPRTLSLLSKQAESMSEEDSVRQEYTQRLRQHSEQLVRIERRHLHLWICFITAAGAGCLSIYLTMEHLLAIPWVTLPVLAAAMVVRRLAQNADEQTQIRRIARFYENGLLRLRGEWKGRGIGGEEFEKINKGHLYAYDLDLFGEGSIFELLCTARTGIGRTTLANWLLHPAQESEILLRQLAIRELRDQLDLREDWASAGGGALDTVDSRSLLEWTKALPAAFPIFSRVLAAALPLCLAALSLALALGMVAQNWHWFLPCCVLLLLEGGLAGRYLRRTRKIAADIVTPSFELSLLGPLFKRMESGSFQSPWLKSLQAQLTRVDPPPSRKIRDLARMGKLMALRQSELATFLAPLLTATNLAMRIEDWRRSNREELTLWLDALGRFEALLCLARHYYENPGWVFPVLQAPETAIFHADSLGHPLLASSSRVTCDLGLDCQTPLLIVSGSNMSGKSTLLRSVGLNAALALAGSPVCAKRLEMCALRITPSISVHDSPRDGRSRFHAEVERLKEILDAVRAERTLFLLDEMLSGTNSKDRLFGARALVKELMTGGAIGLITTHDLALTEIANGSKGRIRNVHFEEHYAGGEMRFDYRMRPGVLTRTNGINVMAALGLLPRSDEPD